METVDDMSDTIFSLNDPTVKLTFMCLTVAIRDHASMFTMEYNSTKKTGVIKIDNVETVPPPARLFEGMMKMVRRIGKLAFRDGCLNFPYSYWETASMKKVEVIINYDAPTDPLLELSYYALNLNDRINFRNSKRMVREKQGKRQTFWLRALIILWIIFLIGGSIFLYFSSGQSLPLT